MYSKSHPSLHQSSTKKFYFLSSKKHAKKLVGKHDTNTYFFTRTKQITTTTRGERKEKYNHKIHISKNPTEIKSNHKCRSLF